MLFSFFGQHFFDLFLALLAVELGLGILIGVLTKLWVRARAEADLEECRVFRRGEYTPIVSRELRQAFPNTLGLEEEFIVVSYSNGEVIQEELVTSLGDQTLIKYENGEWKGSEGKGSPVYTISSFLPMIAGFFIFVLAQGDFSLVFPNLSPSSALNAWGKLGLCLSASGLIWYVFLFLISSLASPAVKTANDNQLE